MAFNTAMESKLSALTGRQPKRGRDDIRDPHPSPSRWEADGVDHINIWEGGATDLGVVLSHSSPLPFTHHLFGRFSCMEAFWHYIQSKERDDRLRTMARKSLRPFARRLTLSHATNFRAIIMESNYQRIKQYTVLQDEIRESTLPFDCYIENHKTGLRQRPPFFKWFLKGFEEIRKAIKEDREPNFNFLLDVAGSQIYEFVAPAPVDKQSKREERKGLSGAASLLKRAVKQAAAQKKPSGHKEKEAPATVVVVDGHEIQGVLLKDELPVTSDGSGGVSDTISREKDSEGTLRSIPNSQSVEDDVPYDGQYSAVEEQSELPIVELSGSDGTQAVNQD